MKPSTAIVALATCASTVLAKSKSPEDINPNPNPGGGCSKNAAAQIHNLAHCVFFFIPEPYAHPEDPHHFLKCCPYSGLIGKGPKKRSIGSEDSANMVTADNSTAIAASVMREPVKRMLSYQA